MAASDDLAVVYGRPLRDFDAEEIQHILDGVYANHAHGRPEAILSELSSFRRIRELDESVVRRFADDIAGGRWPRVTPVGIASDHEPASPAASSALPPW